tara:strand:+ start:148712 stop:148936 length:225 start_codon:yes stop_codon:yes gene_type:complete
VVGFGSCLLCREPKVREIYFTRSLSLTPVSNILLVSRARALLARTTTQISLNQNGLGKWGEFLDEFGTACIGIS